MSIVVILLVLLLVFGGGYSYYSWGRPGVVAPGYAPGGLLGIIVVFVILWFLLGNRTL